MKNLSSIEKDNPPKIPDVYVHGYIYKDSKPAKYANVKLLDENGSLLTQTTANGAGYYSMIICPYGYGFRTVEATYKGETGSNHFTFEEGTWDYEVDIYIGYNPDKLENK